MAPRPRVLVVDDDSVFRELVKRSLSARYIILPAQDGEEALDKAFELRPDVILLDMSMPGWDGIKTLQEIRKAPDLMGVPVIILTADNRRDTVLSMMSFGVNDYTLKDTFHDDPKTLATKLERLLDSNGRRMEMVASGA
jgi:CheY-like chemotaxis protein